jgi:hypothetical protein
MKNTSERAVDRSNVGAAECAGRESISWLLATSSSADGASSSADGSAWALAGAARRGEHLYIYYIVRARRA